jgi:hypothetical protein
MQESDLEWLNPDDEGEETVFEIEPEPIERAAIVDALVHERIRHRWETDNELVVADGNADAVDTILDEVLGVETRSDTPGLAAIEDDDDDEYLDSDEEDFGADDNGEGYGVLSQLYLAVDRLQGSREGEDIMEFASATGVVLMTPPPFGVDEETWADIQSAARNAATALEVDAAAPVDADLKALRNQLHEMV